MKTVLPNGLDELLVRARPPHGEPPNILRVLHAVRDAYGHIDPQFIPAIAQSQGVTEADVAGILSYYPLLNTQLAGRHRIQVCLGESCLANRCDRVVEAILRGDRAKAAAAMRVHLATVREEYALYAGSR